MALIIIVAVAFAVVLVLGTGVGVATRRRSRTGGRPAHERRPAPPAEAPLGPAEAPVATEPASAAEAVAAAQATADAGAGAAVEELRAHEDGEGGTEPATLERPVLRDRLGKARRLLGGYLDGIRGRAVDDATFDELEEALLLADAGLATTTKVLDDLRAKVRSGEIEKAPEALLAALRADLEATFSGDSPELALGEGEGPTVWLFVGVNGVGKTTTIGKVAARERDAGKRVVLAAGDTFRAAAGEQLETWAERSGASLVRGAEGADPSSVIFDAVAHAAARHADLVLADTAGRLHTKVNLMEELRKVRRIAERPPGQLTEVLLVLDATTGQNGLVQAKQFTEAVGVTGVVLTKLDGTAKGGVVLAIRSELGLPIKLVGLGESVADLVEFDPAEFVAALFG
jgi:fused signal recognition particle receptor